jgi:hypothetical protein
MKLLTVLCNVVLVGFTALVVAGEGLSRELAYSVFTLLLVLVPIFTIYVVARGEAARKPAIARVAAVCNLVLFGMVCWSIVDQYPHPAEPGVIPYVVLAVLTPVLNAVVLLRGNRGPGRQALEAEPGVPRP